jgi:hypothetical protein
MGSADALDRSETSVDARGRNWLFEGGVASVGFGCDVRRSLVVFNSAIAVDDGYLDFLRLWRCYDDGLQ